MLGPSESALIVLGARFPPCMKDVPDVPVTLELACKFYLTSESSIYSKSWTLGMNDTANPPDEVCPISDLCAFGGIKDGETPNQWVRYVRTFHN